MSELRFAVFGVGFWARPQLSGWRELPGARCVSAERGGALVKRAEAGP